MVWIFPSREFLLPITRFLLSLYLQRGSVLLCFHFFLFISSYFIITCARLNGLACRVVCASVGSQTIFPALGERKRENESERQSNRMNRYISQIQRHTHAGGRTNIVETKSGDECTIYTCFCLSFPRNPLIHQMFWVFFSHKFSFAIRFSFFVFSLFPPPLFLFLYLKSPFFYSF